MVRPATETAIKASISTPVFPTREASAVIFTEDSSIFGSKSTLTYDKGIE